MQFTTTRYIFAIGEKRVPYSFRTDTQCAFKQLPFPGDEKGNSSISISIRK